MTVMVQNRYFIRAGMEEEGLETRRAASAVRADAGKPVGRIMVPTEPGEGVPTFIWECDYPDMDARDRDSDWAEASSEFEAVRSRMMGLLDHFERTAYEVV